MNINYKDLICERNGDSHLHTNWTDGKDSIFEMIKTASFLNLKWINFSEHNRKNSFYSYKEFHDKIDNYKESNQNLILIKGAECKIMDSNGLIDISSEAKLFADIITGVVHRFPGEKGNIMKKKQSDFTLYEKKEALKIERNLTLGGIRGKNFQILGHPLGMSIKRFGIIPNLEVFEELIQECIENDVIFEVNLRYHINFIDKLISLLERLHAKWTIGSNSHSKLELKKVWNKFNTEHKFIKK